MVERYLQTTTHGEIVTSVYPLELPPDLQGVKPYGALVPESPVSHRDPEMDTLTYKSLGGFHYPREILPTDFNAKVLEQVAETRKFLANDKAVNELVQAVSRESALLSDSIRQRRKGRERAIGWPERLLHRLTGD